ncbi:cytochrome C assembly family protein [Gayadomonas joobiniege]|uniref:cytochrome C assembly family protein n=1 Tax=Gayadomonas joobiniege TaxID=1234606 RepID=UPI000367B9E0|nr:cytochrome c biogenesis protein CcsA [Gayadomonas joobiniege]
MNLALLAAIFYCLAGLGLLALLFNRFMRWKNYFIVTSLLALLCHLFYIASHFQLGNEHAYSLIVATNLIVVLINLISLAFAQTTKNYFALPANFAISALVCAISLLVPNDVSNLATWSPDTLIHILLAIIAYALLIIATLLSYQYYFIADRLKHHDLSVLSLPMPALNAIESQILTLVKAAIILLLLSELTGFIFLENFFNSGQAHKVILSIIALFLLITVIWGHHKSGWRGKIIMLLLTLASGLLTLGYFGTRLIREIILR